MNRTDATSTPHPLDALALASARDLRSLQIKLTFVGPHKAPLPSVVFSSCYHLVDLGWFTALADPALSYGNDAVALMNFTAAPEELVDVIAAVAAEPFTRQDRAAAPVLALDLVLKESRAGDVRRSLADGQQVMREAEAELRSADAQFRTGLSDTAAEVQAPLADANVDLIDPPAVGSDEPAAVLAAPHVPAEATPTGEALQAPRQDAHGH